ncbi:hypothetical protein [Haloarcula salina]|uniref:Uncharacterized protein n=1 Tax=Haloarcula salina TaxID=1429914 RepID=A0AA41G2F0_9EURY|nr:hypothetical protein [Haloarcula salina]MBV0903051.1 hypothetical protein [Haloarcula salina]
MKSGSGDDPFAEGDGADETDETGASDSPDGTSTESPGTLLETEVDDAESTETSQPEIPYKFRRGSVKEGRKQRPIFVRPEVESRETEFIRALEDEVDEDVYKTDALEAALVVAMDHPDLVAEKLREWGYDWDRA